jgi:hypothetical protein
MGQFRLAYRNFTSTGAVSAVVHGLEEIRGFAQIVDYRQLYC